jgi:hypothetical protein
LDEAIQKGKVYYCEKCYNYYEEDYMSSVTTNDSNITYCNDCFNNSNTCFECSSCNRAFDESECYYIEDDGNHYCERCFYDQYTYCDNCSEAIDIDELYEDGLCEECHYGSNIEYYGYKPTPIFFDSNQTINKDLYIGVELEIEGYDFVGFSENIDTDFIYCKRDRSICNGVEIVSHPAHYEYHRFNEWKEIFRLMHFYELRDISNAGLHFHISRKGFTKDGIKNLDYLVNNFESFISKIGGREFCSYCWRENKTTSDWGKSSGTRTVAVNLTNDNTVELRFCKSTYKWHVFIKRLKLIYSLVTYANNQSFDNILKTPKNKIIDDIKELMNNLK